MMKVPYMFMTIGIVLSHIVSSANTTEDYTIQIQGKKVDVEMDRLDLLYDSYEVFYINTEHLAARIDQKSLVEFTVDLADVYTQRVKTEKHVFSKDDYQIRTFENDQVYHVKSELGVYKSKDKNVVLSIYPDALYGRIHLENYTLKIVPLYTVADVEFDSDLYVVYEEHHLRAEKVKNAFGPVDQLSGTFPVSEEIKTKEYRAGSPTFCCREVEMAIMADQFMLQNYGTSAGVESWLAFQVDFMNELYNNHGRFYMDFQVTELIIGEFFPMDPNSSLDMINWNSENLLDSVWLWKDNGGLVAGSYDVVTYFSGRNIWGSFGIAYDNTACSANEYGNFFPGPNIIILEDMVNTLGFSMEKAGQIWTRQMGHVLGLAMVDPPNSGTIMQQNVPPSVQTEWSDYSLDILEGKVSSMSDGIPGWSCLKQCNEIPVNILDPGAIQGPLFSNLPGGQSTFTISPSFVGPYDSYDWWLTTAGTATISVDPSTLSADVDNINNNEDFTIHVQGDDNNCGPGEPRHKYIWNSPDGPAQGKKDGNIYRESTQVVSIEIYDMQGKLVSINKPNDTNLPSGIYIEKTNYSNHQSAVQRVLIE